MNISIIIPTRNEEKYISNTIHSLMNGITKEIIEIIIVDGNSTDSTKTLIKETIKKFPIIKLIENKQKTVPFALNIAIKICRGDYILRLDAHSIYPFNYIMNCIKAMENSDEDNVGGVLQTVQNGNSFGARIVQLVTTHWFGVGDASFRIFTKAKYTDTVPFGFYKKSVFKKVGLFDERLTRNQDYEFNQRIRALGGKIWLDPKIKLIYKNQSTFTGLLNQAFGNGKWNVWMWRVAPYSFKIRHAIPGFFAMGLIGLILLSFFFSPLWFVLLYLLGFYFLLSLFASIQQSLRYKVLFPVFTLPFGFFLYHFAYGLGIITGILLLITGKSEVNRGTRPWNGAPDFSAVRSI